MNKDQLETLIEFINQRVLLERFTLNCDSVNEELALKEIGKLYDKLIEEFK